MNTTPHAHWCPRCERAVDCWAVHDGGCVIASASAMTCRECEWAMWPVMGSMGRVLVWYSDGAASAVAAYFAVQKYGERCEVVKCDTTADEHSDNLRFRHEVEAWIGRKVTLIRSEDFDGIDEVFCAVVPDGEAFTLRDNIFTGNCKACVKATSPAYWARTRLHFPEVFDRRARQSREIGARLVRIDNERVFLDEIPDDFPVDGPDGDIECGPFCEMQPSLFAGQEETA